MAKLEKKSKQNPKLAQTVLNDGRISLYLEYYLGRSSEPALDEDGNQVYYTDGAMVGKPKYKVKHVRKKENLNLYLYANPKDQRERLQNKNTLKLAEDIRHEREKRFLEDREGYKFKKESNFNFLDYFQTFIDESPNSHSYISGSILALRRFKAFLADTSRYSAYSSYIRPDQLTPEMIKDFAEYLSVRGKGRGPETLFNRFKRVVKQLYDQDILRKNPSEGIIMKADRDPLSKEILSMEEIEQLANTHYPHENSNTQRAFMLTLFIGIRFCDVSRLTYRNVDYGTKTLRYEQVKTKGRSSHNQVIVPLNDSLIELIGYPPEDATLDTLIFDLPTYTTCKRTLLTWVKNAGIKKHISWHCGRHSFAVNTLSAGANIKTVSALLGHSSLSMTEKYLHVIDSQKAEAIDSLGSVGYKPKYDKATAITHEERKRRKESVAKGEKFTPGSKPKGK